VKDKLSLRINVHEEAVMSFDQERIELQKTIDTHVSDSLNLQGEIEELRKQLQEVQRQLEDALAVNKANSDYSVIIDVSSHTLLFHKLMKTQNNRKLEDKVFTLSKALEASRQEISSLKTEKMKLEAVLISEGIEI